ncbi:MAG: orotate phosphoribosyltransferase [Bacteriovoracia bacterium]
MAQVDLKELVSLIRKLSYREGHFILSSGKESKFYVDLKNVTLHPKGARYVAELGWQKLSQQGMRPDHFSGVGGPTLGADPMATAFSLQADQLGVELPAFIIRKEPKKHGTSQWIEGRDLLDLQKPLLLVEDVVTTGASSIKSIEKIRAEGFKINTAFAVLDRCEGAREALKKIDIELVTLTTIDEIANSR